MATVFDILLSPEPPADEWILSRQRADKAAGFKIMAHQIAALNDQKGFWGELLKRKVLVIMCFRHNVLMQHVSDMITLKTRQSACWDGRVKTAQVTVNVHSLAADLQKIMTQKQNLMETVAGFGMPAKIIHYEQFKNDVRPVRQLMKHLVNDVPPLTTKLSKQNPDGLRARVVNYDAVVAEMRRIGLSHLVDTGDQ